MKSKREYAVIANAEARIDKQFLQTIISCASWSNVTGALRLFALFITHRQETRTSVTPFLSRRLRQYSNFYVRVVFCRILRFISGQPLWQYSNFLRPELGWFSVQVLRITSGSAFVASTVIFHVPSSGGFLSKSFRFISGPAFVASTVISTFPQENSKNPRQR